MLLRSTALFAAYIAATGGLMYANTIWFGLGDVKFGESGWQLYWPLWAILYAPAAINALIAVTLCRRAPNEAILLAGAFLALTLVTMEISFVFDINVLFVALELVALSVLFHAFCKWWLPRTELLRSGAAPRGFEVLKVAERGPGR